MKEERKQQVWQKAASLMTLVFQPGILCSAGILNFNVIVSVVKKVYLPKGKKEKNYSTVCSLT